MNAHDMDALCAVTSRVEMLVNLSDIGLALVIHHDQDKVTRLTATEIDQRQRNAVGWVLMGEPYAHSATLAFMQPKIEVLEGELGGLLANRPSAKAEVEDIVAMWLAHHFDAIEYTVSVAE
ncbi:hypothetical protein HCZ30_16265 [Marivivens donghaensis]|uniref:Uncharacterized protein n=1 Tax=Marivivens donghaensis TaxID=1699413 RepID=A0ABX0W3D4_9RHOB|nr:hypothetical protein [Marivivens donghaensis]NIY73981.1 hypothetical protein [Marivivens donghaensis]